MWQLNDQLGKLAANVSCPEVEGSIECLRSKTGAELQTALLATGLQFQPITDNITIWKELVHLGHESKS